MGHVREKLHISAPIEVCWDLGSDANRILEWQVGVLEVKGITGRLDRVGASYSPVLSIAGRKIDSRWEVTKVDKPRLVELTGTAPGGGKAKSSTWLEPSGDGTDLTFEIDYDLPGGVVSDIADKLFMERAVERQIRHSNENFKALCEAKVPAHA